MSLFLHYQPSVILQIPLIVQVLNGDFRNKKDSTSRDDGFFKIIIDKLPNSIIVADSEGKINTINKSALDLFGDKSFDTINEMFTWEQFQGTAQPILRSEISVVQATVGNEMHIEICHYFFEDNNVFTIRDRTQQTRYQNLINAEIQKSNGLLKSILPSNIAQRVQDGEKNISFSVQSCSVVFLDIVEFTPWCGSNDSKTIMSTLNLFFGYLDVIISKLSTMERIKLIGDCYVAAGGIFSEPNVPTVHAQEAVTFGLQAIESVKKVNKEKKTNLQIRVGIHTGGPIVAGVIGLGKPTFEILGPAVVMAQQMEHHGIPMAVQMTRAVYELIYGTTIKAKERGNINIKGQSCITYLVKDTIV
jgi:class 3 adenylate cyclase